MRVRRDAGGLALLAHLLAHLLAWAAFLWMVFWPNFYQGTSVTPTGPDGSGGEETSFSASIIEVNGWWVLVPLAVPLALTGLGALTALRGGYSRRSRRLFLWVAALLLAVFCGLALFSIGVFYAPAALALLVAAVVATVRPEPGAC